MIQRLENAGLGFYVKSTETVHKLGEFTIACMLGIHIVVIHIRFWRWYVFLLCPYYKT